MSYKGEFATMLVLSTAHVSEETMGIIEADGADCTTWVNEYGAVLSTFRFNPDNPEFAANNPEDLVRVLEYARARQCAYVMLDRDAERVDELPTFDW